MPYQQVLFMHHVHPIHTWQTERLYTAQPVVMGLTVRQPATRERNMRDLLEAAKIITFASVGIFCALNAVIVSFYLWSLVGFTK